MLLGHGEVVAMKGKKLGKEQKMLMAFDRTVKQYWQNNALTRTMANDAIFYDH